MTIKELKQHKQDLYSGTFEDLHVFFAFGNEQFEQEVNKLRQDKILLDGEKLSPIGAGGYVPAKNLSTLKSEIAKIEKWYKFQVKELKDGKEDLILYELNNFECFYSNDITDALDVLIPLGITKKEVETVYNKHKNNEQ
jgi:hypothetical protein